MVKNPRSRAYHLRRVYGITPEQYQELFEKQQSRCNVCRRHQEEFDKSLAVDHNHKTREIRGLLCQYCNHRLIGRHTDAELLRRMADHLDQHTGWFVPEKTKKSRRRRRK